MRRFGSGHDLSGAAEATAVGEGTQFDDRYSQTV